MPAVTREPFSDDPTARPDVPAGRTLVAPIETGVDGDLTWDALARDDPGVLQIEEDVLQKPKRHRLRTRERLGLDVPFSLRRQLDRRAQCVVGLRRESH